MVIGELIVAFVNENTTPEGYFEGIVHSFWVLYELYDECDDFFVMTKDQIHVPSCLEP